MLRVIAHFLLRFLYDRNPCRQMVIALFIQDKSAILHNRNGYIYIKFRHCLLQKIDLSEIILSFRTHMKANKRVLTDSAIRFSYPSDQHVTKRGA